MVKHQRRSHQHGNPPYDQYDYDESISDSGSDSPSTPRNMSMQWHQGVMHHQPQPFAPSMNRAASYGDFNQNMSQYNMHQQAHQQPYGHRNSLPSNGVHEYPGLVHPAQQGHPGMAMIQQQRTPSLSQAPVYITDQANPGVATMNTSHMQQQQTYNNIPRQQAERPPLEIPGAFSQPGLAASLQSSPSDFSGRSPLSHEAGMYTFQPPQAATQALQAVSPANQAAMNHYQLRIQPHPQEVVQVLQQAPPTQHEQQQQLHPSNPSPHHQPQWHENFTYQPPQAVGAIGPIPGFNPGAVYGWNDFKDEDANGMQMPSARVNDM